MKFKWQPHFMNGYHIAKHNGCSIIRSSLSLAKSRHFSMIGNAMYEVMDKEGEIHRFNTRKEMENFVNG